MFDFNNAEKQNTFDLIPAKTICPVCMTIRPGGAGEDGWLKQSQSSDAQMLDCEFTVAEGPYYGRKFWQNMVLSGGKLNDRGESIAGGITRSTLRAILESARGINPDDMSAEAMKKRCVNSFEDFQGMTFLVEVKIEKDKTGFYDDKNAIGRVITPNMKEYNNIQPQAANTGAPVPPPAGASRPAAEPASPTTGPIPSWAM